MALPGPNGLGKTLLDNSGPCNVVLRPFRMFSLGQRVQPATMIEFKEIEYFDHTGSFQAVTSSRRTGRCSSYDFRAASPMTTGIRPSMPVTAVGRFSRTAATKERSSLTKLSV